MPFPNFHACRLISPIPGADTATTSRTSGNGKKYNIINQRQANGSMAEQSFRYPKDIWSVSEASAHCKRHNGILFEPATTTAMERLENEHTLKAEKKEYLIIPRGDFDHPQYGKLAFGDKMMDEMLNNFNNSILGETKPFVDQDHDQRGAAGWFVSLRKAAEGIFGAIEWTPVGVELIKNKIYKYFSPTISSYTNPQSGEEFSNVLRGGALTNMPFLKMLPEITLTESGLVEIALSEITEWSIKMDYLKKLKEMYKIEEKDDEKAFAAILVKIEEQAKLAESKSDTKELDELKKQVETLKKELETKKTELTEKNKTKPELEIKLDEAVKSNKALSEKMTLMERDTCIKRALSEGRMLPDSKEKYEKMYMQNPQLMEEAISTMPVVIELKQKGDPNNPEPDPDKIEMSEAEKEYHKAFGHSKEDIKKYRD